MLSYLRRIEARVRRQVEGLLSPPSTRPQSQSQSQAVVFEDTEDEDLTTRELEDEDSVVRDGDEIRIQETATVAGSHRAAR